MGTNSIELRTINALLQAKCEFYIPSYQRGYRWNRQQVMDLLSDLWEFYQKNPGTDEFYCLQPVVVRPIVVKGKEKWEVIDGQQRLTTIFIILSYMKANVLPKVDLSFSIEYETRPGSGEFLLQMDAALKDKNIDYFHMYAAYEHIREWFEASDDETTAAIGIYEKLRNQTKIIWYQINDSTEPIDIFTRINLGKIPLTNAELVKALFLKKDNFGDGSNAERVRLKQLEIAGEWDRMEFALQHSELWFFLNDGKKRYDTRIEFIFEMMSRSVNKTWPKEKRIKQENNEYFSFLVFSQLLDDEKKSGSPRELTIDRWWRAIRRFYMTFEEWFSNRELYHLVGYLVATGVPIEQIKDETENKSKGELKKYLLSKIAQTIPRYIKIEDLTYENNRRELKKILLLFNVISIMKNDPSIRFPFDRFKSENWDLEHIHAVHSAMPMERKERQDWLKNAEIELDNGLLKQQVKDALEKDTFVDNGEFEQLYTEIIREFGAGEETNDISNLTLLDAATNRSYKNAMFPTKRRIILSKDKLGTFIPICTKNVFLKYYNKDLKQVKIWGKVDRKCYFDEILDTLKDFLSQQ